ncbi:MAG: winged helix-turn-helix transcriptional regulator, partial [Thermoplasmata archaeon]
AWDPYLVMAVQIIVGEDTFSALDTSGNNSWYTWEFLWNTSGLLPGSYLVTVKAIGWSCIKSKEIWLELTNTTKGNTTIGPEDDDDTDDDDVEPTPGPRETEPQKVESPSGVKITPFAALIIITAITISIFSIVVFGMESGKYKLLSLVVVPLYSRRKKDQVLDNFIRGEIYGFISAHPGTYFNHMKLALNLNNGTLAYHLNVLENDNMIYSKTDRNYRRFYPTEGRLPSVTDDNGKIHTFVFLNTTQNKIIKLIQSSPGLSQKEIAQKLGKSSQVINYNINSMAELGLVKLQRDGKLTRCYSTDLYPVDESLKAWEED